MLFDEQPVIENLRGRGDVSHRVSVVVWPGRNIAQACAVNLVYREGEARSVKAASTLTDAILYVTHGEVV